MISTIHECCSRSKNINASLAVRHYAKTRREAIQWLEAHGGGIYRDAIRGYKFRILAAQQPTTFNN